MLLLLPVKKVIFDQPVTTPLCLCYRIHIIANNWEMRPTNCSSAHAMRISPGSSGRAKRQSDVSQGQREGEGRIHVCRCGLLAPG